MEEHGLKLKNAPIVEAVLDIECDMPPGLDIAVLEKNAQAAFGAQYPEFRAVFMQEHRIDVKLDTQPIVSTIIQGFQFLHGDGRQIVQVRKAGYSFHRLAPYSTLDDYLPEMETTWNKFVELVSPVQVRTIRLRYINRILLPLPGRVIELADYFKIFPRSEDEGKLVSVGFLNQNSSIEEGTGDLVNRVVAAQPAEDKIVPIILDIAAASRTTLEPGNWVGISEKIQSLRALKNMVFRNTLTQRCLDLFKQ